MELSKARTRARLKVSNKQCFSGFNPGHATGKALIFPMLLLAAAFSHNNVVGASETTGSPSAAFPVGIVSPWSTLNSDLLGCSALVDLDVRKHTEPELVERFGPPIVNLSNVHPDLKVNYLFGTDDSSITTAMKTILDWMQGPDGTVQVVGVVGTIVSSIIGPMASTLAVFDTPQVTIGGAAASLGDKVTYPYLVRVAPSNTVRGAAVWSWMAEFKVTSVTFIYTKEPFGESVFQATADIATSDGQPGRVSGAGVPIMEEQNLDMSAYLAAVDLVKSLGSKVIVMTTRDTGWSNTVMYALEQRGLLYSDKYQILGAGGVAYMSGREIAPSRGYPTGMQLIDPLFFGSAWPPMVEMWQKMVPADVYGADAAERYMLNKMKVLPEEASRPMLTEEAFQRNPWSRCSLLFDASYTFAIAINNLLNAGTPRQDIAGRTLLDAVRDVEFDGVTGHVQFDTNGDRLGAYSLMNAPELSSPLVQRAVWQVSTNTWTFTTDQLLVWTDGNSSRIAPAALSVCDAGRQWDVDAGFCTLCPPNWYSGLEGHEACQACDFGTVGNAVTGATACVPCSSGTVRALGERNCTACPLGKFAASGGLSECEACPVGTYGSALEASSCSTCGSGKQSFEHFTTMATRKVNGLKTYVYEEGAVSIESCGCDIGYREDRSGECVLCTVGMTCLGMNDVRILPGFYADTRTATRDLLVYRCYGNPDRCSGGLPGQTCAAGREGLGCALCMDGMTSASDGTCVSCEGADHLPVVVAALCAIAALVATYHFVDRQNPAAKNTMLLLCAIAIGQSLTVVQQLGVVSKMSLQWEDPLKSTMRAINILTFDVDLLRSDCVNSHSPPERFAVNASIIYMGILTVLIIHICYVVFRHHRQWGARTHALIGMIGTLFMVLYLAVTSALLQPLQCVDHPSPNHHWTVRTYPSVICWESEQHSLMLAISVASFLTVPVFYLALCVAVVLKFPSKLRQGDSKFLQAFSFLFFRFRASCYAFVLVQTLRSFIIALILVVPDTVAQLVALQVALLAGYTATLYVMPWRIAAGNILDLVATAGMLMFVLIVSLFIEEADKKLSNISALSVVLLASLLALLPLGIGRALYLKFGRRRKPYEFFLTHHKAASGAYTRLLKMIIVEKRRLRSGAVFLDSDNLDNLDRLFDYVGNDTATLVVLCTAQIFSRPWCVGEICTAMIKKISTVVVALPGSSLPEDADAIESCMESLTDWKVLTENGMDEMIVREAFGWINQQSIIRVPKSANNSVMTSLVDKLVARKSGNLSDVQAKGTDPATDRQARSGMVYDLANLEAAATASILWKMLFPLMATQVQNIPKPLEVPELPPKVVSILFICTNGLFENTAIMNMLGSIPKSVSTLLPIMCEAGFRFPSQASNEMARTSSRLPYELGTEMWSQAALAFAEQLFKEIAITFLAQVASDAALDLAAKSIASRLAALPSGKKGRDMSSGSHLAIGGSHLAIETDKSVASPRNSGGARHAGSSDAAEPHVEFEVEI